MSIQPLMGHLHHVCTYTPRLRGHQEKGLGQTGKENREEIFERSHLPIGSKCFRASKKDSKMLYSPWFENETFPTGSHTKNLLWAAAETLGYWASLSYQSPEVCFEGIPCPRPYLSQLSIYYKVKRSSAKHPRNMAFCPTQASTTNPLNQ